MPIHRARLHFFHSYQYSALFTHISLLAHLLKLLYIVGECHLVFAARRSLYLVCVLQFFYPLGLLSLELRDLPLNLLSFVVLSRDSLNQGHALRLALHLLLVLALGNALGLGVANHGLHLVVVHVLRVLLQRDHFLML